MLIILIPGILQAQSEKHTIYTLATARKDLTEYVSKILSFEEVHGVHTTFEELGKYDSQYESGLCVTLGGNQEVLVIDGYELKNFDLVIKNGKLTDGKKSIHKDLYYVDVYFNGIGYIKNGIFYRRQYKKNDYPFRWTFQIAFIDGKFQVTDSNDVEILLNSDQNSSNPKDILKYIFVNKNDVAKFIKEHKYE